ncbi:MAG: tetratricopeptide repeat protein [Cyanobacteria bacterium P01_H01_bin.15]
MQVQTDNDCIHILMNQRSFSTAIANYETALNDLSLLKSTTPRTKKQAVGLAVLNARDLLADLLREYPPLSPQEQQDLLRLDDKLRSHAEKLVKALDLETYRRSFPISEQAWWWHLETTWVHSWNRWDWLWKFGRVGFTAGNLALLADFITRFFASGAGLLGAVAVVVPGTLTLLQADSEVNRRGEARTNQLLKSLKIPTYCWEEVKFGGTFLLFCGVLGLWHFGPTALSRFYRVLGWNQFLNEEFAIAEKNLTRAIAFNPENIRAHYNLGVVYEELGNVEGAQAQYQVAGISGWNSANINLSRLLIQEGQPDEAAQLLVQNAAQIEADPTLSISDQYDFWTYLGWARLKQDRFTEAEEAFAQALDLTEVPEAESEIPNLATVHCLLAQTLEQQENPQAIDQWRQCQALGNVENWREDKWVGQACQRLAKTEEPCE